MRNRFCGEALARGNFGGDLGNADESQDFRDEFGNADG
jgi:hypothetical protein